MKTLLTIITLLFCITVNSQATEINTIVTKNIGSAEYSVKQMISDGDTTQYIVISFRNAEYKHITDYGYFMFRTEKDAKQFTEGLASCLTQDGDNFYMVRFDLGTIAKSQKMIIITNNKKQWYSINSKNIESVTTFMSENYKYLTN